MFKHQKQTTAQTKQKRKKKSICFFAKSIYIKTKELFVARHHFHQLLRRKQTYAKFVSYQQKKRNI
jgi:hypothetical protein